MTDRAAVPPAMGVLPASTVIVPLFVTVTPPAPVLETARPLPLTAAPGLTVRVAATALALV